MTIMDEVAGEVVVRQDPLRACVEIHIRGRTPDQYRVIRLARHEARQLAASILLQAEKLGSAQQPPADEDLERRAGLKSA
jgi:hypothetical protein